MPTGLFNGILWISFFNSWSLIILWMSLEVWMKHLNLWVCFYFWRISQKGTYLGGLFWEKLIQIYDTEKWWTFSWCIDSMGMKSIWFSWSLFQNACMLIIDAQFYSPPFCKKTQMEKECLRTSFSIIHCHHIKMTCRRTCSDLECRTATKLLGAAQIESGDLFARQVATFNYPHKEVDFGAETDWHFNGRKL